MTSPAPPQQATLGIQADIPTATARDSRPIGKTVKMPFFFN